MHQHAHRPHAHTRLLTRQPEYLNRNQHHPRRQGRPRGRKSQEGKRGPGGRPRRLAHPRGRRAAPPAHDEEGDLEILGQRYGEGGLPLLRGQPNRDEDPTGDGPRLSQGFSIRRQYLHHVIFVLLSGIIIKHYCK